MVESYFILVSILNPAGWAAGCNTSRSDQREVKQNTLQLRPRHGESPEASSRSTRSRPIPATHSLSRGTHPLVPPVRIPPVPRDASPRSRALLTWSQTPPQSRAPLTPVPGPPHPGPGPSSPCTLSTLSTLTSCMRFLRSSARMRNTWSA